MADHLLLPAPRDLASRRLSGNARPAPVVRRLDHGQRLSERLRFFSRNDIPIDDRPSNDENDDTRLVLKFKGNTRLPSGPLNRLNFIPLGEDAHWNFYVLSDAQARSLLNDLLQEYMGIRAENLDDWDHPKTWAMLIDNIQDIELYSRQDRLAPELLEGSYDLPGVVDVLLWPSSSPREAARRVDEIRAIVRRATENHAICRLDAEDPRPDQTLVRVNADDELFEHLAQHPLVERIRPPLRSSITVQSLASPPVPVVNQIATQVIGVVDGLVSTSNPLTGTPLLVGSKIFPEGHTPGRPAIQHGTAVAGAAAWGDLDPLVLGGDLHVPHPIAAAVVLEDAGDNRQTVVGTAHSTIADAIRWLATEQHCRIVSLSINHDYPATITALREELTYTIDSLARELDLVIVVSAGNRRRLADGHWLSDYPSYLAHAEAGVAPPGDAALAVTVGSIARRSIPGGRYSGSKVAISPASGPSPFTRLGPTRGTTSAGVLKPEFYAHGGNWAWDHATNSCDARDPGISSIVPIPPEGARFLGASTGTSYAAPSVAHEIARIAERYPAATANTLRALAALSGRHLEASVVGLDPLRVAAYGVPDADRVLESGPQRVFLLYEGMIETGHLEIHRLPIPAEYADGTAIRTFRVALAFDPPVRRRRKEYIAGTMSVEFVRGLSVDEVERRYKRQPTTKEAERNPELERLSLPDRHLRPDMKPGPTKLESNTLIRREFLRGSWDPDHRDYFVLVGHDHSPWSDTQKREYTHQRYSLVVEVSDESRTHIDLYAMMQARLRTRARIRGRVG